MTISTAPNATTYNQLLDRVITEGITEVREAYADSKEHHKRDGAIEGFEACRGRTPADLVALWTEAESNCRGLSANNVQGYWKQRYKALQIEWVCNVISVGLVSSGQPPLLGHLPTARGAMKYASIIGVIDTREEALS